LCRRLQDVVLKVAAAGSTAVVGGPVGRWLTSPEERFANRLIVHGVPVVFAASGCNMTQRRIAQTMAAALAAFLILMPRTAFAQTPAESQFSYGALIDVGGLISSGSPANHLFRNRGTTPRLDELDVNMAAAYLRRAPSEDSRIGVEGYDSLLLGLHQEGGGFFAGPDNHLSPTQNLFVIAAIVTFDGTIRH
jgi:hypothetical protein